MGTGYRPLPILQGLPAQTIALQKSKFNRSMIRDNGKVLKLERCLQAVV
jgi:hypothetical protein